MSRSLAGGYRLPYPSRPEDPAPVKRERAPKGPPRSLRPRSPRLIPSPVPCLRCGPVLAAVPGQPGPCGSVPLSPTALPLEPTWAEYLPWSWGGANLLRWVRLASTHLPGPLRPVELRCQIRGVPDLGQPARGDPMGRHAQPLAELDPSPAPTPPNNSVSISESQPTYQGRDSCLRQGLTGRFFI